MSVYFNRARDRWAYDFEYRSKRYSGYCVDPATGEPARTKTDAKRIEALMRAAAVQAPAGSASSAPPRTAYTVAQMFAEFASRKHGGKNWPNEQMYIRDLMDFFGSDTPVEEISEARIWEYIAHSRKQPIRIYLGAGKRAAEAAEKTKAKLFRDTKRTRSDSTTNRYLICLGQALRIARSLRDGAGRPLLAEVPKVPRLIEPKHLPHPVADEDLLAVINHPEVPRHLADGALLVRLMGFRKAEVFNLTIRQVDFANRGVWLQADETKGKRAEFVQASEEAMLMLERLVRQARQWG